MSARSGNAGRAGGWGKVAVGLGAAVAGVAVGYAAERAALGPRLHPPVPAGPAIGSLEGDVRDVRGPDGVHLHVERSGTPGAPQVVFVHGWCNDRRVWHEQLVALAEEADLLVYDHPGHGRSSSPASGEYSIDLLGDTLATVIDDQAASGPIVLVGHSLGGMTVMNVARRYPEIFAERVVGAVLLSTTSSALATDLAVGLGVQIASRVERGVGRLIAMVGPDRAARLTHRGYRASSDLSFLVTRTFGLSSNADPRYVDLTEQMVLDADPGMLVGLAGPVLRLDEDAALACLTVPMAIAVGGRDQVTPVALSRRMAERCPHAELTEIDGVGHMLPLEAHAEVTALIRRVIAQTRAPGTLSPPA